MKNVLKGRIQSSILLHTKPSMSKVTSVMEHAILAFQKYNYLFWMVDFISSFNIRFNGSIEIEIWKTALFVDNLNLIREYYITHRKLAR